MFYFVMNRFLMTSSRYRNPLISYEQYNNSIHFNKFAILSLDLPPKRYGNYNFFTRLLILYQLAFSSKIFHK